MRTGVPKELERIVEKCMAKEPERRYQHVDELLVDLRILNEGQAPRIATRPLLPRSRGRNWWYAASSVVGILLIAAVVGFSFRNRRESGPVTEYTAQHLTSLVGVEDWPTLSPDGSQVAFVWNGENQDNADIYVQTIGSGNPLRLTSSEEPDLYPAWSPDGRTIAFQRQAADGNNGIYLSPPLGGSERKIGAAKGYGLAWSPDSRWLVISDRESSNQTYALQLLSIDTGEKRALMSPRFDSVYGYIASAFSPDGRSLAFSTMEIGHRLTVLDLNDDLSAAGEPRRIENSTQRFITGMAWTADGAEVVISGGLLIRRELYRVKADGSSPATRLDFAEQAGNGVALGAPAATHGGRLVFSRGTHDNNIYRLDLGNEGRKVRQFAPSTLTDASPQFSPDGKMVVFASNRAGNRRQIWVCEADGAHAIQLTFCEDGFCGSPRWSPDGRWIAFDWRREEVEADIYVVSSEGGPVRRVTEHANTDFLPSWSRDGNWIYFASSRSGDFQIWKLPAAGGTAQQVTRDGGYVAFESPDGSTVYFTKSEAMTTSLWKIPVSGGKETEVLPAVFLRNFALARSGIWHAVEIGTLGAEIRFLDFSSGAISVVHRMTGPAFYALTVSPDEKSLLFVQSDQTSADLMLVEGFE